MIVYIHSHEIADRGYTFGRHSEYMGITRHIIVPDGTTVSGICSLVSASTSPSSIDLLIFNGHGNPHDGIYFGDWIDAEGARSFSTLGSFMNQTTRGQGVQVHCCYAAAFGNDLDLVRSMHRAFQTKIVAPFGPQLGRSCYDGGPPCLPIDREDADYTGVFEGPIAIISGNGTVTRQTV